MYSTRPIKGRRRRLPLRKPPHGWFPFLSMAHLVTVGVPCGTAQCWEHTQLAQLLVELVLSLEELPPLQGSQSILLLVWAA